MTGKSAERGGCSQDALYKKRKNTKKKNTLANFGSMVS